MGLNRLRSVYLWAIRNIKTILIWISKLHAESLALTIDYYNAEAIKTGNSNTFAVYRKIRNRVTKLTRKDKSVKF